MPVTGRIALDVGASTGGFTDCLLQRGAAKVYAVDVGTNQLAWKLRSDPRVVSMEKTNIRDVTNARIPEPIDLIVCDASFIGLRTALPVGVWGWGNNPQWAIDMTNGRLALSQQARQTVYSAAIRLLLANRPAVYLAYILNRAAYSNRLTGIKIYPDSQLRVEFAAYKAGT